MKTIKQLIFCCCLLFSTVNSFAQDSGTCGDSLTWTFEGGTLTISGTGAMTDYVASIETYSSNAPWFKSYYYQITQLKIGDNVTSIGNGAFYGCNGLTSVTIPDGVTSIGSGAFFNCSSLTSIAIPNSVTSIGNAAFEACSALASITIPDGVTSIGSATFYNCNSLTSFTIPNSVTSIGDYAFSGCTGLTSVTIPNSVISIGNSAFSGCTGLTSFTIPNSVTSIGSYAFSGCTGLTSATIPNSVTGIGDFAFYGCTGLTSITISDGVTYIWNYAFFGCTGLISVTIPNSVINIGNGAFYGCIGLTSFTIPNSVTSIGDAAFYGCTGLTSFTIPNSVTYIGITAFSGCGNLISFTCYALEPPFLRPSAFDAINSACILYVPAGTLELYKNAEGWNSFASIVEFAQGFQKLTISFSNSIDINLYKNLFLEISNDTEQIYSLTTGNSNNYSFYASQGIYKAELKNKYGAVVGQISDIEIKDKDVSVVFSSLESLYTVSFNFAGEGIQNLSGKPVIKWYDETGAFLQQGDSIAGVTTGMKLKYSVDLDENQGKVFVTPPVGSYTVAAGNNRITLTLQKIPETTILGAVKDENGSVLSGALVTVTQLLNGKYSQTTTAKTDGQGKFSVPVFNDSTVVTVSSPNYLSKTLTFSNFSGGSDLGIISLSPIAGARIALNLSYTRSLAPGETSVAETGYSDYRNVDYRLFDRTKNKEITQFVVQYPEIALTESVDAGDQIEVTAFSRTNSFDQVQSSVTISDELREDAQLNIVQRGFIRAMLAGSANAEDVGIIYGSDGILLKSCDYRNYTFDSDDLPDGSYTLISMAKNRFFNTVLNLSALSSSGLTENTDYVRQNLIVKKGEITEINVPAIPALDENKLYYTGAQTLFSVNKTSITAGNYLTLRTVIDFKEAYTEKVSNVKLITDIPEQCSFVSNSIIIGNSVAAGYSVNNNRLTIPLTNYSDIIRFCIVPVQRGSYTPNAFVQFDMDGKTITQPIGAANFTVEDLSIFVPDVTAQNEITVRGAAAANSEIKVYDEDVLIGQTQALATGDWSLLCELYNPYAFSYHNIHAEVTTTGGLTLQTETKQVTHNITAIEPAKVTMINTSYPHNEEITVFDFLNPSQKKLSYNYYPAYPDFTFKIEFTNNDPALVSNVELNVLTTAGDTEVLPTAYDSIKQVWVATGKFDSYRLPTNVSVDYAAVSIPVFDKTLMADMLQEYKDLSDSYQIESDDINNAFDLIDAELSQNNPNTAVIDSTLNSIYSKYNIKIDDSDYDSDEYLNFLNNLSQEEFDQYGEELFQEIQDHIDSTDTYLQQWDNSIISRDYLDDTLASGQKIAVTTCEGLDESNLINSGFEKVATSDNQYVYIKITETECTYVDFNANVHIVESFNNPNDTINSADFSSLRSVSLCGFAEYISKINNFINLITGVSSNYSSTMKISANIFQINQNFLTSDANKAAQYLQIGMTKGWSWETIEKWSKQGMTAEKWLARNQGAFKIFNGINGNTFLKFSQEGLKYIAIAKDLIGVLDAICQMIQSIPDDCPGDSLRAENFRNLARLHGTAIAAFFLANTTLNVLADAVVVTGWGAIVYIVFKMGISSWLNSKYQAFKDENVAEIKELSSSLRCNITPPKSPKFFCQPASPFIDPSGYVYEAVPSNRLAGVTATIYFKTQEENMYGDLEEKITMWNAEEYGQENPMLTNERGEYGWDVPAGVWQVKYEKDGYLPVSTDWLPVPPPQLDVNMAKVQPVQPTVLKALGYESGIVIEFDKFMLPDLMTTENISVTRNGTSVSGTVVLLNEEPGAGGNFVSKVRFVPDVPFSTSDEVILTVKRDVKSYADIEMAEDFVQRIEIQKEMTSITVPPVLGLSLNEEGSIEVSVEPKEAAAGKKITARSVSSSIAGVSSEAVLDANGKAVLEVTGELPGSTVIYVSVAETDMQAQITINVAMPEPPAQVEIPTASIPSGSTVDENTTMTLSSNTAGATIYYTIDGSTPSASTGLKYTQPIVLTKDVTILAIAVKEGMSDSDIAVFEYTIENGTIMEQVEMPVASIPSGSTVDENTTVTLSSNTAGATIYYTLDGSTPSASSGLEYTQPIVLTEDLTIRAIAVKEGMSDSDIAVFEYSIVKEPVMEQVEMPAASIPSGSTVSMGAEVSLSTATDGASIFYTTDGFTPSVSTGLEYVQPIVLTKNVTIQAIAVKEGMLDSEVAVFEYTVDQQTGIAQPTRTVVVFVKNQTLFIRGLETGDLFTVHSVLGNIVVHGKITNEIEQRISLPNKGAYIVSTSKIKAKVLVK